MCSVKLRYSSRSGEGHAWTPNNAEPNSLFFDVGPPNVKSKVMTRNLIEKYKFGKEAQHRYAVCGDAVLNSKLW